MCWVRTDIHPTLIDRARLASVIDKASTAVIGVPVFLILKDR